MALITYTDKVTGDQFTVANANEIKSVVNSNAASNPATIVALTGTTTLDATAYGKLHTLAGTAADYAVNLPTAVGFAGQNIRFKGLAGLTRFVTITRANAELIDGASTQLLWAKEYLILISDGANWIIADFKRRPFIAGMRLSANQTGIVTATLTTVALDTSESDPSTRMNDTTARTITIRRAATYNIGAMVQWVGITPAATRVITVINKNGTQLVGFETDCSAGSQPQPGGSCQFDLAAGDVLNMQVYQTSGSNQAIIGGASGTVARLFVEEIIQ